MKPYKQLRIALCSDHAGFQLKATIIDFLKTQETAEIKDFGCYSEESLRNRQRYQYDCQQTPENQSCTLLATRTCRLGTTTQQCQRIVTSSKIYRKKCSARMR